MKQILLKMDDDGMVVEERDGGIELGDIIGVEAGSMSMAIAEISANFDDPEEAAEKIIAHTFLEIRENTKKILQKIKDGEWGYGYEC